MKAQSIRSIRWRQMSVRSLLLVISVTAIFFAWFGWRLRLGHQRDAAVEKIVRAGGDVAYSSQFDGHYSRHTASTFTPSAMSALLERLCGTDPFRRLMAIRISDPKSVRLISEYKLTGVEILALRDSEVSDADTVHVRDCKRLKVLTLDNTPVSDRSIDNILECRQLEQLYLRNTKVTEEGIKKLARLPRLDSLDISGTPVARSGLKVVATLPSVSLLSFDDPALTTEELRNLRNAPSLRHLWLEDQTAVNIDLAVLREFPRLKSLMLTGPLIKDDAIKRLAASATIKQLELQNCSSLTDESLVTLAKMPSLEMLQIRKSPFSAEARTEFTTERPDCTLRVR
jgi:hypothetical protein